MLKSEDLNMYVMSREELAAQWLYEMKHSGNKHPREESTHDTLINPLNNPFFKLEEVDGEVNGDEDFQLDEYDSFDEVDEVIASSEFREPPKKRRNPYIYFLKVRTKQGKHSTPLGRRAQVSMIADEWSGFSKEVKDAWREHMMKDQA